MATTGTAYAISVGIYAGVLLVIFIAFSIWRRLVLTRKFYCPKRYSPEEGKVKPPLLPNSFLGWVPKVVGLTDAQVLASAGVDAALYVKAIRCCWEAFFVISILVLAILLPINLTGKQVDKLMDVQAAPAVASDFTFWIPPPPPPASPQGEEEEELEVDTDPIKPPKFYTSSDVPEAPPGVKWEKYADGIPPLPPAPPRFVWWYDSQYVPNSYKFSTLDKTTLSNIEPSSADLVAHAVVAWAITFVILFQLWRYCKEALRLRMYHLLNAPRGAESHSILTTDIPAIAQGTIPNRLDGTLLKFVPKAIKKQAFAQVAAIAAAPSGKLNVGDRNKSTDDVATAGDTEARFEAPDRWKMAIRSIRDAGGDPTDGAAVGAMVEREFRDVYHEDFVAAHMVFDTSKLDPLVNEYETLAGAAEDLVDDYISKGRRGDALKPKNTTVLGAKMGAWGREKYGLKPVKVDIFDFYTQRLTYLKDQIATAQAEARKIVFSSAFITFNRRTAQVVGANALMSEDLSTWRCQPAPRPEEIIWKNIKMRGWERSLRGSLMWGLFISMALFYIIPVSAIQALVASDNAVAFIDKIPIASTFLTAMLPSLVLTIFIAIVPLLIRLMNRFAGMISASQVDLALISRFFIFQVIVVFLASFIAGSAASQFEQLIDDPESIVDLLGAAAPQTAIFFLTYVTLQGLFVIPFEILRLVPFIIFWVKSKFLASTERAKARLWQNQSFDYGTQIPKDTIIALLAITFACICPIIAPAALIYFSTSYVVRKHDVVYVYKALYQTGGKNWTPIFYQIITGVFIFHAVMICLLSLKKSVAGPLIVIPLPFLTFIFCRAAAATFWRPMEALSLMAAAQIDDKEGKVADSAGAFDAEVSQRYLSPSFKPQDERHAALMDDVKRIKAVIAGGTDKALFERDMVADEESAAPEPEFQDAQESV